MEISVNATKRELDWLLDRELDKPIKEIDTSFIDFIVDVLIADISELSQKEINENVQKIMKVIFEEQNGRH